MLRKRREDEAAVVSTNNCLGKLWNGHGFGVDLLLFQDTAGMASPAARTQGSGRPVLTGSVARIPLEAHASMNRVHARIDSKPEGLVCFLAKKAVRAALRCPPVNREDPLHA